MQFDILNINCRTVHSLSRHNVHDLLPQPVHLPDALPRQHVAPRALAVMKDKLPPRVAWELRLDELCVDAVLRPIRCPQQEAVRLLLVGDEADAGEAADGQADQDGDVRASKVNE